MKPSFPPTLVTGLICGISSDRKQDLTGICALGLPGICWNACGRNMAFSLWHVYMKQAENKIKHGSATGLLLGYVYKKISLDQVNRYI